MIVVAECSVRDLLPIYARIVGILVKLQPSLKLRSELKSAFIPWNQLCRIIDFCVDVSTLV